MGINPNHPAIKQAAKKGLFVPGGGRATTLEALVRIPLPPSVNDLYFNRPGKGRVKTREYEEWLEVALPLLRKLRPPSRLPCCYNFCLVGRVNQQSDGSNREKALLDACVAAGVIPDDNLTVVRGGMWGFQPTSGEPEVIVWFDPWSPE